ncbi:hypothetical protein P9112_011329 [Eukaryota sp. TZLM1-RC]
MGTTCSKVELTHQSTSFAASSESNALENNDGSIPNTNSSPQSTIQESSENPKPSHQESNNQPESPVREDSRNKSNQRHSKPHQSGKDTEFSRCHSRDPIVVPEVDAKFTTSARDSVREKLRRSCPDLIRQEKFLFDSKYAYYFNKHVPDKRSRDKALQARSMWVDANKRNLNRFLITKHWDVNHRLVEHPLILIRNTGPRFEYSSSSSWVLYRAMHLNSITENYFLIRAPGVIQTFCKQLQKHHEGRRTWYWYFWNAYNISKHFGHHVTQSEKKTILEMIITLIQYVLDYHEINASSINDSLGITRPSAMLSCAKNNADVWVFLPRMFLYRNDNWERHVFTERDFELAREWNLRETTRSGQMLKKVIQEIYPQ